MNSKLIRTSLAGCLGLLLAWSPVQAKESKALPHKEQVSASLSQAAGKKVDEKRKEIIAEAVTALKETFNALKDLEAGKKDEALKALANATGKLELVVTRDPSLALAPVDVTSTTYDVIATADEIKAARKEVIRLLEAGNLPAARELLDSLRSEIVVNVVSIPLATYPDAIKAVTPLIDAGKIEEAKEALRAALGTLVITRHIIPLPLLRADEALVIAEVLAEKKDRTEKENRALENMLDVAQEQLELAEAFGYGTHAAYQPLYAQLNEIREKVSGGKSGTGFFDKLKASMSRLKAEIFGVPEVPAKKPAKVEQQKQPAAAGK